MAAIDDLHAAIARGHIPGGVLDANGITGADAIAFKTAVERRDPNPAVPASAATALGVSAGQVSRNLGRRVNPTKSGR